MYISSVAGEALEKDFSIYEITDIDIAQLIGSSQGNHAPKMRWRVDIVLSNHHMVEDPICHL